MKEPGAVGSWNHEVVSGKDVPVPWVWKGLIAEGAVTLLTGAWKGGKSTLLAMLLDRRRQGGELLGRRVRPGLTVVVSEEDASHWARRQRLLDFGPQVYFCRPLATLPPRKRWRRLFDHLFELEMKESFDLLVIDPLAHVLPVAENDADSLRRVLDDVRGVSWSAGVLLTHHPRQTAGRPSHRPRGSGALPAFADILLELRVPPGDPATRRRELHGIGRYPETPRRLLLEMNADATDYAVLAEPPPGDPGFAAALAHLCAVLGGSPTPLSRHEILARWPVGVPAPAAVTLWRWLERACTMNVLLRQGEGNKADAFRYGLAGAGSLTDALGY